MFFFQRFVRLQIVSVCAARHVVRACAANKFYNFFLSLHRFITTLLTKHRRLSALANLRLQKTSANMHKMYPM